MKRINDENYFDYSEALYCFASLNHEGQGSDLYSILSQSTFQPGPLWSESNCIKENFYFSEITSENAEDIFSRIETFLEETKK